MGVPASVGLRPGGRAEKLRAAGEGTRERFSPRHDVAGASERMRLDLRAWRAGDDFCQMVFVRVADYYAYAGERGDFFWGALSVASRHYDLCFGILAADAADGGARVLICCGRDRAGVHHYH